MGLLLQGIHCSPDTSDPRFIDHFLDLVFRVIAKRHEVVLEKIKNSKESEEDENSHERLALKNKYVLINYYDDFEEITQEIYTHIRRNHSKFDQFIAEYAEKSNEEKDAWIKITRTSPTGLESFLDSIGFWFTNSWFRELRDKEKRAEENKLIADSIKLFGNERFKNSTDLNSFFNKHTEHDNFVDWFNSKIAKKGFWKEGTHYYKSRRNYSIRVINNEGKLNFTKMWDGIIDQMEIEDGKGINLFQFLSIQSPAINETGGWLHLTAEEGSLKYTFRYNYSESENIVAEVLFRNTDFITAHKDKNKTSSNKIAALTPQELNDAWGPVSYFVEVDGKQVRTTRPFPEGYETLPSEDLFVAQADFYKFRGRGYIQTTHRGAYRKLIQYVRGYPGSNAVVIGVKTAWDSLVTGMPSGSEPEKKAIIDKILSCSTNKQWDDLFMKTDYFMAGKAILEYKSGYQQMEMTISEVNDQNLFNHSIGSFYFIGRTIGGSEDYGRVVRGRIIQMLKQLLEDYKRKNN